MAEERWLRLGKGSPETWARVHAERPMSRATELCTAIRSAMRGSPQGRVPLVPLRARCSRVLVGVAVLDERRRATAAAVVL